MPRSPLNHKPLLVLKANRFMARPKVYTSTGGHPGIDIVSPLTDPWLSPVVGVYHIINWWPKTWGTAHLGTSYSGYGQAVGVDWGQADGFIRFVFGHGTKRHGSLDGKFVHEGDNLCQSGNTGFSSGPHLHFEMRKYNKDNTGKFIDSLLKRKYNLLDPEKDFLIKFKIPYQLI